MQSNRRRRAVSSCIPCYNKKQKCNRQFPCNHCTRRRRPEECIFQPQEKHMATDSHQAKYAQNHHHRSHSTSHSSPLSQTSVEVNGESKYNLDASVAESFGYFEDSECNTMALIRKFGLTEETQHGKVAALPPDVASAVQKNLERMHDRPIYDFLMQYYMSEVNWMYQLVYPSYFLLQYQRWWAAGTPSSVADVEFAVLLVRMCSYASQFLPSPSHMLDTVRGVSLADIRNTCNVIGDNLAAICRSLDTRGSLPRVQHIAFAGLISQVEGKTNDFWEKLNCAIRVAQRIGIDRSPGPWTEGGEQELQNEMQRRTFCNLYVWDSSLSRQLDRVPFLPDRLAIENLPRRHLGSDIDGTDVPESFTERLLQVRLATFWRRFVPRVGIEYNLTVAEERYESFRSEFLDTLPSAFALTPNEEWDDRLPMISLQRRLLHIQIFDSICWNFRHVLFIKPQQALSLPPYKRVLLSSQKKALAAAALHVLDAVSSLHSMLGASHTRFDGIIFPTFEAAVLLVCLCMDLDFSGNGGGDAGSHASTADPLGDAATVTRDRCLDAAGKALDRLQMLAEVSKMAEAGARTLDRFLGRATREPVVAPAAIEWSDIQLPWSEGSLIPWSSFEEDISPPGELFSATASEDSYFNHELLPMDSGFPLVSA